jgi:hypothetical protein
MAERGFSKGMHIEIEQTGKQGRKIIRLYNQKFSYLVITNKLKLSWFIKFNIVKLKED